MTSLQSQFAIDLFPLTIYWWEVPTVNKPRRACLYFNSLWRDKIFSAPFYHANGNQLGDECKELRSERIRNRPSSGLDFNIYTTWKIQLAQCIYCT